MRPRPPRTPAKIILALTVSTSALTAFVIGGTSEANAENEAIERSAKLEREAAELAELEARLAVETRAIELDQASDQAQAQARVQAAQVRAELEARELELAALERKRTKKKYGRGY